MSEPVVIWSAPVSACDDEVASRFQPVDGSLDRGPRVAGLEGQRRGTDSWSSLCDALGDGFEHIAIRATEDVRFGVVLGHGRTSMTRGRRSDKAPRMEAFNTDSRLTTPPRASSPRSRPTRDVCAGAGAAGAA